MNVRRELREYAKAGIGMLAGALMLAYVLFLFVAHNDYFCRPAGTALAKAYLEEVYQRGEVCPQDEMNGDGP